MSDLRNKLLADRLPKRRVVLTKFENAEVEVRSLTTGQRLRLVKDCTVGTGDDAAVDQLKLIPMLIILTTFDPADGTPVFEGTDALTLEDTCASTLDELLEVTLELNGFDDPKKAVKNSAIGQTSTIPSSSQSGSAVQ